MVEKEFFEFRELSVSNGASDDEILMPSQA